MDPNKRFRFSRRPAPWALALVFSAAAAALGAQAFEDGKAVVLSRESAGAFRLVERSDWARYDNGKYTGHVYRETRGSLSPRSAAGGTVEYAGDFFVLEETLRDLVQSARAVDDVYPAAFKLGDNGSLVPLVDHGFPTLRGFPAYPEAPVLPGQKWTARFTRAVDPRNDGRVALLPLIAEFQYVGEERYKGARVHHVVAKYATRYSGRPSASARGPVVPGGRALGAPAFSQATGTHDVDIVIDAETGVPILLRDRLDETFTYPDGATLRYKGFTLTFSEGVSLYDRDSVIAAIKSGGSGRVAAATPPPVPEQAPKAVPSPAEPPAPVAPQSGGAAAAPSAVAEAPSPEPAASQAAPEEPRSPAARFELADLVGGGASGTPGIGVEETPAGVKLTVRDLRFVPDSDAILPEEKGRIELIARALSGIPDKTFLVEGHTAAVGKAAGELELSARRAKRVVDELVARGIPADRFIFKGWGGTKPLADNGTDAGRAKNRRVEITVLD
jgi:outer membrane protein OmpA-like peptidoglycan-associated protein